MGGEKGASYTLFAHSQFPSTIWEFGNSVCKICFVTLTSTRHANFSYMKDACLPLATLCVWKITKQQLYKALSSLLEGIVHVFVHTRKMLHHPGVSLSGHQIAFEMPTQTCSYSSSKNILWLHGHGLS